MLTRINLAGLRPTVSVAAPALWHEHADQCACVLAVTCSVHSLLVLALWRLPPSFSTTTVMPTHTRSWMPRQSTRTTTWCPRDEATSLTIQLQPASCYPRPRASSPPAGAGHVQAGGLHTHREREREREKECIALAWHCAHASHALHGTVPTLTTE